MLVMAHFRNLSVASREKPRFFSEIAASRLAWLAAALGLARVLRISTVVKVDLEKKEHHMSKAQSVFTRIACCAVALVAGVTSQVHAETITQTKPYSVTDTTTPDSLTFNLFDPSLGTLTGVTVTVDGTSTGSVNVQNTDVDSLSLADFFNKVRVTFSGTGSKPGAFAGAISP